MQRRGALAMTIIVDSLTAAEGFRVEGEAEYDGAGQSVAGAGDVNGDGFDDFIVSAPFNDAGGLDAGAAYIIFGKAGGLPNMDLSALTSTEGFKIVGEAAGDWTGFTISSAGDVNGDGLGDLIIGSSRSDVGGTDAGAAFVVFGKATGFGTIDLASLAPADGFRLTGDGLSDQAGSSVSSAGDINGDGLGDIIVGAPGSDSSGSGTGGAYVIFGTKSVFSDIDLSSLDASQGFTILDTIDAHAGADVAPAGDINGDGFDDLFITAPNYGSYYDGYSYVPVGALYVIFGKAGGPGDVDIGALTPDQGTSVFGEDGSPAAVAPVGDLDGDGLGDFAIGASILYGSSTGIANFRFSQISQAQTVAGAGDVNGDGFADLIVVRSFGSAFVLYGRAGGLGQPDLDTLDGIDGFQIVANSDSRFGQSVSGAGDINGDGFDDIIVGAPNFREVTYVSYGNYDYGPRTGAAYVIYGQAPTEAVGRFGSVAGQAIRGGAYDDTLDGREGDDRLFGAGGNDTLIGGLGADLLDGGTGADTLIGGTASDTYVIDNVTDIVVERAGEGNDLVRSSVTFTLGDNVERLTLTGVAAVNGTGNALANTLTGNAAANVLAGSTGNDTILGAGGTDTRHGDDGSDTLDGGTGADAMNGGLGNDSYKVDNAGDKAIESSATGGTDRVTSSVSFTLGANVEQLTLTGTAANGTGNTLANVISGDAAANILNGKAGADTMSGGDGNDVYYVDTAGDVARETSATGGTDRVISSITFTVGANVERLTLSGTDALNGTGNTLANTLIGNGAANTLKGLAGADILQGGAGDDTLQGGAGRDTLTGGTGNDKFLFLGGDSGATHALADHVTDFATGDVIDLHFIDANSTLANNNAFHFIGAAAFTVGDAGALHYSSGGGVTWIEGDTDGDGIADVSIYLAGDHTMAATDFVL
jgi:Ca2+-binding RTX toxin-like protein